MEEEEEERRKKEEGGGRRRKRRKEEERRRKEEEEEEEEERGGWRKRKKEEEGGGRGRKGGKRRKGGGRRRNRKKEEEGGGRVGRIRKEEEAGKTENFNYFQLRVLVFATKKISAYTPLVLNYNEYGETYFEPPDENSPFWKTSPDQIGGTFSSRFSKLTFSPFKKNLIFFLFFKKIEDFPVFQKD
jgi:hypothetical protein